MIELKPVSREESCVLTDRFSDQNYVQLWDYAELAALRSKSMSEQVKIENAGTILGMADVRIKSVPAIKSGLAYVNRGPLTSSNHFDSDVFAACLQALKTEYVEKRNLVLRIQAPIVTPADVNLQDGLFAELGFQRFSKGYQTIVKHLDSDESTLMQSLNKKWRSELRRSQKTPLQVVRTTDLQAFDQFEKLFDGLRSAKGFNVDLGIAFYKEVQQRLPEQQRFVVHIAYLDDQPVAGHIGSYLGNVAVYLFGASNDRGRDIRAAYLLHWEVMRYALACGISQYDLGGVDSQANPGVFRFKNRFNGESVDSAGLYQVLPDGISGRILLAAERMYRWIGRFK